MQDALCRGATLRSAPIFVDVRADRSSSHQCGILRQPDLVVPGDETIVPLPMGGVLVALDAQSALLFGFESSPLAWSHRLALEWYVRTLPVSPARRIPSSAAPSVPTARASR